MTTLVWALVALIALYRVDFWMRAWMTQRAERSEPNEAIAFTIPDDLEAFALEEDEVWAQQSVRKAITQRFLELQDWNLVRRAVGIGGIDA